MRPIPGFPGYFADQAGLIWNARSGDAFAVSAYIAAGFLAVTLRREDGSRVAWLPVHRLVLLAFLGERAADCPCFHGCRGIRCNALDNLRVTRSPLSLNLATIGSVLDALAEGQTLAATAERCGVGLRTVSLIRQRFGRRRKAAA